MNNKCNAFSMIHRSGSSSASCRVHVFFCKINNLWRENKNYNRSIHKKKLGKQNIIDNRVCVGMRKSMRNPTSIQINMSCSNVVGLANYSGIWFLPSFALFLWFKRVLFVTRNEAIMKKWWIGASIKTTETLILMVRIWNQSVQQSVRGFRFATKSHIWQYWS